MVQSHQGCFAFYPLTRIQHAVNFFCPHVFWSAPGWADFRVKEQVPVPDRVLFPAE